MRRYGIARYLTDEQRERAATATYERVKMTNVCQNGDCERFGEFVEGTRARVSMSCPLGIALYPESMYQNPVQTEVEYELSKTGENERIRAAAARFIHDIDNGTIGPDDVAAALGYEVAR